MPPCGKDLSFPCRAVLFTAVQYFSRSQQRRGGFATHRFTVSCLQSIAYAPDYCKLLAVSCLTRLMHVPSVTAWPSLGFVWTHRNFAWCSLITLQNRLSTWCTQGFSPVQTESWLWLLNMRRFIARLWLVQTTFPRLKIWVQGLQIGVQSVRTNLEA